MKLMHKYICFLFICLNCSLFGEEKFLYHGSSTDDIERLEPSLRYTPGEELDSPASIYASDLPAFAAAHSFPWSSDEGIDLYVDGTIVTLEILETHFDRLQKATYIYLVADNQFSLLECESSGHTFRTTQPVDCLQKISFPSVVEAIEHYGGRVIIQKEGTTKMPKRLLSSCVFCKIACLEQKADIVAKFKHCYAMKDAYPVSKGHILIIPYEHTENWFTAKEEVRLDIMQALDTMKKALDIEYSPGGYNIGANCGEIAGQTVMHLHVHLIPRYKGDMEDPRGGVRGVIPSKQKY
jgi:diadenosine tetraphosphate (Ap4A) HIT family hydrolase